MEPTATAEFVAAQVDDPVLKIQDFDRVVQQYWPRIYRFALATLHDSDSAETLAQDCFWKAYKNRTAFRGECSLNTWLMRIAVNLARDHARSRRFQFWKNAQRSPVDAGNDSDWLPDGNISPEERASLNEQIQTVWNATKGLSERQRTVFVLRFVEDLDIREIAESTGLSESAVSVHLFRAVRAVRKRVRELQ